MITLRTFATIGVGCLIALVAESALAVPFTPVLDEFWVNKNGTNIFADSFNDNVPPPSGPDGANTYVMVGAAGITSEAGGKLTMTPSLGDPVLVTTTYADVATAGLRRSATNPNNPNILDQANSFDIHGLYDMSNLPTISGQSFGIRANDRAPDLGYQGNNTFNLFVGVSSITGDVSVFLRENDFTNNSSVVLWSQSIQSVLTGADQIELILSKDANSNMINASYSLFDYSLGNPLLQTGSILDAGALYQAEGTLPPEPFVRAQFISTDRVTIPEPATVALLGIGLAGLSFARKRRTA
jgi:hypothetical protein